MDCGGIAVTNALRCLRICLLACGLAVAIQPRPGLAQASRDGQHDFDFEIGTWTTRLSVLKNPLTGSTTWVKYEGTTVVRPVWDGRANLVELEADGPAGHIEALSLRLYNPQSRQWSLNFSNVRGGTLSPPAIGAVHRRPRRVLLPGIAGRSRHLRAVRDLGDHAGLRAVRAVLFAGRRQDLGAQLGGDGHPGQGCVRDKALRARILAWSSWCTASATGSAHVPPSECPPAARPSSAWAAATADEVNFLDAARSAYFISEERQIV